MALTPITAAVDNVQQLDTKPNSVGGLTDSQLKAVFDKTGGDIKTQTNVALSEQDVINADIEARQTVDEGKITDIETKTDFITVTQTVNLDTMESDIAANTAGVADRYTKSETDTLLDEKVSGDNVLEKDNTTAFTPTGDYNPSTKKYVDDTAFAGVGDNSVTELKQAVTVKTGQLSALTTTEQGTFAGAINEVNQGVTNRDGASDGQVLTSNGDGTSTYETLDTGANGKVDSYKPSTSSVVSQGSKLTLDGTNDYGTLPANVGQLTDGTDPFEMVVKFNANSVSSETLMCKGDTTYTTNTSPKRWALQISGSVVRILANPTNGGALVTLTGTTTLSTGTDYWVKMTFDGTTVELLLSTDGISFTSEGTSTDSNLITGLSISDAVDTQIGRLWAGSSGFLFYYDGDIRLITLNKNSLDVNGYTFNNAGTNTAILDTVGSDNGSSFNGATQADINGIAFNVQSTKGITDDDGNRCMWKANQSSDFGGSGLTLDGSDDYGTVPASVGQLTNGSNAFELITKINKTALGTQKCIMSKQDTTYSGGTVVKGWRILTSTSNTIRLYGTGANGGSVSNILGASTFASGTDYWVKVTFNGTTVELLTSTDGISYNSEGTSTDSNLINGLSTSDSVDTQMGQVWMGSLGNSYQFDGSIDFITISKLSTPTNEYLFENLGADQAILDTEGSEDGLSFNGALQGSTLTGSPTLLVDSNSTAPITFNNISKIEAGKSYESVAEGGAWLTSLATPSISNLVAETSLTGSSVTISDLDINADGGEYIIELSNIVTSLNTNLRLYYNGDTTETNYRQSTQFGSLQSDARISPSLTSSNPTDITTYLKCNNNKPTANSIGFTANTAFTAYTSGQSHISTQSNITSLTFAPASGTFTSGTAKIYKRS